MLRSREPLLEVCEVIAEQENLKVTIREAAGGALMTGFGALLGGLVAGPVGLAIGGTVTSITAAWMSRGSYRSVVDILRNDLTLEQQRKLTEAIKKLTNNIGPEDYAMLLSIVLSNISLREAILKELGTFLVKELNLQMIK